MSLAIILRNLFSDAVLNFQGRNRFYILKRNTPVPETGEPGKWGSPRYLARYDDFALKGESADGTAIYLQFKGTRKELQGMLELHRMDDDWTCKPISARAAKAAEIPALPAPSAY